jgi:hypothetical protein
MELQMDDSSVREQSLSAATLEGFTLELQIRDMLDDDNISLWSGKDEDNAAEGPAAENVREVDGNKVQSEEERRSDGAQIGGVNDAALSSTGTASVGDANDYQGQHQSPSNEDECLESRMNNSRHRAESTITATTTRASTDRDTRFTGHDAQPASARDHVHRPIHPNPLIQEMAEQNPDMLLDFPNVSVDELEMELHNFTARVTVEGRVGNLVKVSTGVNVNVGDLKVSMKGVQASALLVARLDNVKQMMNKALVAAVQNPDLLNVRMDQDEQPQPQPQPQPQAHSGAGGGAKGTKEGSAAGFTYEKR